MPFEGSTLQCDARKTPQCDVGQTRRGRGYDINGKRKVESGRYIPPPHFVVLPLSQGEKVDGVQITDGR